MILFFFLGVLNTILRSLVKHVVVPKVLNDGFISLTLTPQHLQCYTCNTKS